MAVLCSLALSGTVWAQFDTATVVGTVKDSAGLVVDGSKVTLSNLDNGTIQTADTNSAGDYQFSNVRVGRYSLKAEKSGFSTAVAESVTLTVNARQRVDLTLQVGQAAQQVVVSGVAEQLETESSNRGTVIATRQILDLPLNGRSYADLTLLSPGVRKSVLEDGTVTARDASYNVNGQRSALNNFVLDGVDNNAYGTSNQGFSNQVVQLSPDAVQEYRVETSNYSAEFGRAAGAVINATTRSGGNQFHGAAWEFLRNTSLNAVGFFQPAGGVKPTFIQNQYGAAFGGPIKKDKLFFFVDYEGLQRVQRSLQFATVPTMDERQAQFSTPITNPTTGETYVDGRIPASAISPFARAVIDALPAPNLSGSGNNFQSLPRDSINDNKGDMRVDWYATSRITSFFRFSQREDNLFQAPNIPGPAGGNSNGNVKVMNKQLVPGATWTLGPSSVLEARLGVTWTEGGKTPIGLGQPSLLTENGITGLPTDPNIAGSLNTQSVTGYSQFGRQSSNPQFQNPYVLNPKVNYSHFWGRHSVKFGYEYQAIDTAIDDFNPVYGQDTYSGKFSGNNLADFYLGLRSSYQLNNFVIVDYRQRMHFAYVQDDWKVNDKLTLNLGLRYEFATPQWEKENKLANFDPATNSLIQAKDGSLFDRALVHPQYNNWAPRVGLAYRLFPKTVIRSGYGISYIQFNRLGGENLLAYNGPNIVSGQITQDLTMPFCASPTDDYTKCFRTTQMGYPENFAVPANFNPLRAQARYIPSNNPTGYVQSWHVTIQHQLAKDLMIEAAYVGNKGTHIMILADYNQAAPNQPGQNLSLQARRPIQNFNAIEVAYGAGVSSYNALQVKLEKRFSAGLYVLNSFTWSKNMDNASGHLEANNGDNSRVNFVNLRNEIGPSGYDQPLNDTLSFVWELPYGKGRRWGSNHPAFVDAFLGGWALTGISTATTGLPINLSYTPSSAFTVSGFPTYRPNTNGQGILLPEGERSVQQFFNVANLSIPTDPSQPFGNLGRNVVRGYDFFQFDLGLHKQFGLWNEASRLEFRAEAFNLSNRSNFKAPDGNLSNNSFGTTTSTFPARQIQFALKLYF